MSIITVKDLCVDIKSKNKTKTLVKNISFEVSRGECLGILGESGSGKSITVKAFTGLLDKNFAVGGSAFFGKHNLLTQTPEQLRRLRGKQIAMVLQNPMTCFDPLYRIRDQIAETFAVHTNLGKPEIYNKSLEILQLMQIRDPAEVLEKYPHQLSGGMLQRIMIGIALAMEPDLLIADEPTTAIDAITQYEILGEFKKIKQSKKTAMIFISHDLGAISQVADHVLVMQNGQVVESGSFTNILKHSANPYTKMLVDQRSAVMARYRSLVKGAATC